MGFFSRIFSSASSHERELEEGYVSLFQTSKGMSPREARAAVRDMIRDAKAEGEKEGTAGLASDFGDQLLAREATADQTRIMLAGKRKEGVRDEDIRWWWNMPDLDRRILLKDDDLTRMNSFIHHLREGLSPQEASARVRRYHPVYGDPDDTTDTTGDDQPLPCELKDRVNVYVQRRVQDGVDSYKKDIEAASTFNALIRREMRDGKV